MSYLEHCKLSLNFSFLFLKGCFFAVIHAFIPDLFISSTTDINQKITKILESSGCRKEK